MHLHVMTFWLPAVPDLDIAKLAKGFALLQLPKMPELKGKTFTDFKPETVDVAQIPFK